MSIRQIIAQYDSKRAHRDAMLRESRETRAVLQHIIGELLATIPTVSAPLTAIIELIKLPEADEGEGTMARRVRAALSQLDAELPALLAKVIALLNDPVKPLQACIATEHGEEVNLRSATDEPLGLPAVLEIEGVSTAELKHIVRQLAPGSKGDRQMTEADEANNTIRIEVARETRKALRGTKEKTA